jgi:hypothetical protein
MRKPSRLNYSYGVGTIRVAQLALDRLIAAMAGMLGITLDVFLLSIFISHVQRMTDAPEL